ncbi:hypothetical protein [uncultured Oscillibacter sp.]|uniref:hypothetical protein n=1 Tax=uncultured Oscillibacter sp. TaxID=876091 RepID=UPI00272A6037|nr:hypothetical protein [uncultured Oscillibacter sp.]
MHKKHSKNGKYFQTWFEERTGYEDREKVLEETYDELENDLRRRIEGIQNQIALTVDKRNTIIQVNRAAKTAMEVFDDILVKPRLDRNDLQLIIHKIKGSTD